MRRSYRDVTVCMHVIDSSQLAKFRCDFKPTSIVASMAQSRRGPPLHTISTVTIPLSQHNNRIGPQMAANPPITKKRID